MDLGNIIYIVAILAYFIYQATRKKKDLDMPDSDESAPESPQKGMTFEDLMKEIRQAQNPTTAEKPMQAEPKPVIPEPQKPEPYQSFPVPSHIPQAKAVSRKPVILEDDEEIQYYEGSFGASKKVPFQDYKSANSAELIPSFKMDYDAIKAKKTNPYAQLLKNPKTLKEAVVLSEILKPKYF
jgi:hypothetical protein